MDVPPLDPGKSTVYVANLPYHLKTQDIQEIFEKYGEIVKVTLLTVQETRRSKGVAFVLFRFIEDAINCIAQVNNSVMHGQTIKASIARDNGRAPNSFQGPSHYSGPIQNQYDNDQYYSY